MIKDKCISVTDLRSNTKKCLEDLDKSPKVIFSNSKPVAVLIDIDLYEDMFKAVGGLVELSVGETTDKMREKASKASKMSKNELVNL